MDEKQTDDHSNQFPHAHLPGQVITPGQTSPPDLIAATQTTIPQAAVPTPPSPNSTPPTQLQPSPSMVQSGQISPKTPKPKRSKLPLLIGLVVVFLLLAGGGAYAAIHLNSNKPKPTTNTSSNSKKKSTGSTKATTATTATCTSETCFSPYFTNCTPATLDITSALANTKYQTYGKEGTGCSMLFEYTANPNSAWTNQPMTCDFDNTKALDDSTTAVFNSLFAKQNTYDCTGPLVAILESQ